MDPTIIPENKEIISYFNPGDEDIDILLNEKNDTEYEKVNVKKINIILGKSIFINYNAIITANLDALSFGSKHIGGSLQMKAESSNYNFEEILHNIIPVNTLTYCVINDNEGGVNEYLVFRKPESVGFGINSIGKQNFVNVGKNIDLQTQWKDMIMLIQKSNPLGVDWVIINNKESNNLLLDLTFAVYLLNNDGVFTANFYIWDINILYLCSLFFTEIKIMNLLSSDNGLYLICKGKKYKTGNLISLLNEKNLSFKVIPDNFMSWIEDIKDNINKYTERKAKEINPYKPFIIWNIPDSIATEVRKI